MECCLRQTDEPPITRSGRDDHHAPCGDRWNRWRLLKIQAILPFSRHSVNFVLLLKQRGSRQYEAVFLDSHLHEPSKEDSGIVYTNFFTLGDEMKCLIIQRKS